MSFTYLAFATLSTLILAANLLPALSIAQTSTQAATFNLSAETLNQPYWLSIRSSANSIRGQITLNGKVIKQINGQSTTLNLSPYLRVGRQTIIIQGNYTPDQATVTIELQGNNTQVSQQTSGNGLLNQILTIEVR